MKYERRMINFKTYYVPNKTYGGWDALIVNEIDNTYVKINSRSCRISTAGMMVKLKNLTELKELIICYEEADFKKVTELEFSNRYDEIKSKSLKEDK